MTTSPCPCKRPLPDDARLLTAKEAADTLSIGTRTLSRFVTLGRIRPVRFSARCVRFRLTDVRTLIDSAQKARTP
ncbi:MAG TPA: helix-turn-helix domain-containing protein [Phycisphaerae bacterium]|nr:helix-turn-helix domain-containing protein [Phycisphaerae bacterium]